MMWPFFAPASRAARPCTAPRPALGVECLEDRSVPATFAPNGFGGGNFSPFDGFAGDVRTASGDVNGDGVADIITAQGPGAGSGSRVRIFDGFAARFASQTVVIADFFAYSNAAGASQTPGFAGGVFVAAGDLNGDGFSEVITSPGTGASGHIKVFDFNGGSGGFRGSNPALQASFFAYPGFLGEIRVATVNRANGQSPLLVTASGAGASQSDIRMFNNAFNIGQVSPGTFVQPAAQAFPFPGFRGGVSVAGGNPGQLFVSPNVGQSLVSAFNLTGSGAGAMLSPGGTFPTGFNTPTDARLGSADVNGDGLIDVLSSSPGGTSTGSISALSLAGGGATSLGGLSGFQGFGMFGGTWLSSGSFAGSSGLIGPGGGVTNQGLIGPGTTQGLTGVGTNQGVNGNPVFFNSGAGVLSPGVQGFTPGGPTFFNSGASSSATNSSQSSQGALAPGIF